MDKIEAYKKLSEISSKGVPVTSYIIEMASSNDVPKSVSDFIRKNSRGEIGKFFDNLRELSRKNNHRLYRNIMNESLGEVEILKCLSSYMTSVVISLESMGDDINRMNELKSSSGLDIVSKALYEYYNQVNYDGINSAIKFVRNLCKSTEI